MVAFMVCYVSKCEVDILPGNVIVVVVGVVGVVAGAGAVKPIDGDLLADLCDPAIRDRKELLHCTWCDYYIISTAATAIGILSSHQVNQSTVTFTSQLFEQRIL